MCVVSSLSLSFSSNKRKKENLFVVLFFFQTKKVFIVVLYIICLCVRVCFLFFFLAQVFEMDSDTHSSVLSLCVFYANKLSFSRKTKIVRLKHITHFVSFLAFCFIVHNRSLFISLCRILFAKKTMHLLRLSHSVFFLLLLLFGLMMIMYMVCIL